MKLCRSIKTQKAGKRIITEDAIPIEQETAENSASAVRTNDGEANMYCPFCKSMVQVSNTAFVEIGEYDDDKGDFEEEADAVEYICTSNSSHVFYIQANT